MKKLSVIILIAVFILSLANGTLWASSFISDTPLVTGGTVINFENDANGNPLVGGTHISTQYAGVTFGQAPNVGSPQIDVGLPTGGWMYAFGGSSGTNVLIGSTEGGYGTPAVAGITITFLTPVYEFQTFFSDTKPLGNYTVTAFGSGGVSLESFTILQSQTLSAAYLAAHQYSSKNDLLFPKPYEQQPLPGIYIGFQRSVAEIQSILIGPGSASLDSFAIDDVQFNNVPVPEPTTILLLGIGLIGLTGFRRKIK